MSPSVQDMSRFLGGVAKVLGWFMALVVGGYVVVNGALVVKAQFKRNDVGGRLTDKLAAAVPAATSHRDALTAAAGTAPEHAWIVQVCDFPTTDSGWMVNSYNQECELRSAVAFAVATPEAAEALARQLPDELGGAVVEEIDTDGACRTIRTSGRPYSEEVQVRTLAITRRTGSEGWCGRLSTTGQHRVVSGEVGPLDANSDWVVVLRDQPLDRTDIGCLRWSVQFCDNPFFDKPAWGDLPK